jgi:hypothetical protein
MIDRTCNHEHAKENTMNATATTTNATLTAEQRQARYNNLIEDLTYEGNGTYEKCKAAFAEAAAQSGYGYAARWKLIPVLEAEHRTRCLAPALAMMDLLVRGEATVEVTEQRLQEYTAELTAELVRQKPWEHRCTCAATNLDAECGATAKAQAVEKMQAISFRLFRLA